MADLIAHKIKFYSQRDERSFFERLKELESVIEFSGVGPDIIIRMRDNIIEEDLREIIAIFFRYKVDMSQLRPFLNDENEEWFGNKKMFWYKNVFID